MSEVSGERKTVNAGRPTSNQKRKRLYSSWVPIQNVRVFAPLPAAIRSISRSAAVSCQSRQVLKFAGPNIAAHFIEHRLKPATLCKNCIDLTIPCGLVPLPNEFRQLG